MGSGFEKRPVDVRVQILSAIGDADGPTPKAAAEAAEALLVGALDDTEERSGMSGSWNGKSFADPRVCDIAGHVLHQRWPKRYRFDMAASLTERDQQRVVAGNGWRQRRGMPTRPLPRRPVIAPVGAANIDPRVARLRQATTAAERQAAREQLVALGLGALAPLQVRP